MFFRQIKYKGDNFSYVIGDEVTKESAIVDLKESGLALEESEGEEVPEIADEELEL